jgi:nucleoside-diphosphate-sugar epimerase
MELDFHGCRVAIVGATGFIGSHIAERLVELGAEVLAIARSTTRLQNLAGVYSYIRFAKIDITQRNSATKLFLEFRPQKVFHLASHPDSTESFEQMRISLLQNTEAVLNVLEASAAAKVETFIFGDSSKVYGNTSGLYAEDLPDNPHCSYAIAKAAGWRLCKLYSALQPEAKVVGLRPTMVYGPRQNLNLISYLFTRIREGGPIAVQGGWQTRNPLHIDDAVDAYLRVAASPAAWGHSIPIGGPQELTVAEICRQVLATLGATALLEFGAAPIRLTELFRSSSDNRDAFRLLGWQPRVSLPEGISRLAWHGAADFLVASAART